MTDVINTREIVLAVLTEVLEEDKYSHIVLREVLEKYQYLEKRDRSFITRVTEGTLENLIEMDYIISQFSSVKGSRMKPVIRNILRMSVYQLKYMDSVPDSAVCNEGVKLAQRKGFFNLKGFVNGVLRSVARNLDKVKYPDPKEMPVPYLSVTYSMPEWILQSWLRLYDFETVETICRGIHKEHATTVRCNLNKASKKDIMESLQSQGVTVTEHPYLDYALNLSDYNYLKALDAFRNGWIQVQDVSSMLVAEVAAPKWGDYCIDVCAAPGGKALHLADKLEGSGFVEARDITESKVQLMQDNIERTALINMNAVVADATVFLPASVEKADVLLADVPCSGLGVIGRKPDIRYKMTENKQEDIVKLQRQILDTCTIGAEENQYNLKWFLDNYPFKLESIDPYLPEELQGKTTRAGYLQLLPGVHESDGFFLARLKRVEE